MGSHDLTRAIRRAEARRQNRQTGQEAVRTWNRRPRRYRCECGEVTCTRQFMLSPRRFEAVAAVRGQFLVARGHEGADDVHSLATRVLVVRSRHRALQEELLLNEAADG